MCWHKWGKWSMGKTEQFEVKFIWDDKYSPTTEVVQYRTCMKCGKIERRKIEY